MNFDIELKNRVDDAERIINSYMPKNTEMQKTVLEAMDYTMSAGGKRVRPVLMKAVYDMLAVKDEIKDDFSVLIEPFMAAIEMIHTYSLIHDDLPALDNDDYRRGRKTAHVVYGEDIAILAGDGLLNYAYETAAKAFALIDDIFDHNNNDEDSLLRQLTIRRRAEAALTILARKPGVYGMIGGQVVDVELTGQVLTKDQLNYIYRNKTGALIEAAMTIGAVLSGASKEVIENVSETAYNIGMAFQIQDDILDETATFEELGKPIHSDKESGKITYVTLYGTEASVKEVLDISEMAIDNIIAMGGDSEFLVEFVRYLIHRKK